MTRLLAALRPRTVAAQITAIVVAAVLVGILLTALALTALVGGSRMRMDPEVKAAAEAARIAILARRAEAAPSPDALAAAIAGAQAPEGRSRLVTSAEAAAASPRADGYAARIAAELQRDWQRDARPVADPDGWSEAVAVEIGQGRALLFQESEYQALQIFITVQAAIVLALILLIVLALSTYAVRWITRPLAAVAAAATAFGRSLDSDPPLAATGPAEIAQLAAALDEMRRRIRKLVDERTGMLAAIGHDLRTPLTRLRLRAERLPDPAARDTLLSDIAALEGMVREALAFLRDAGTAETVQLVDLPSLLQTICGEYADTGHDVAYRGPDRFNFRCRAGALTRALANIIDNGVKHGTQVVAHLETVAPATVRIEIADDGPGIPAALREKVFEPFFKADTARSALRSGFGLGLSIARDIVDRQGGSITLSDNAPSGLRVKILLQGLA